MKKKVLPLFLVLSMLVGMLSMMPITISAADMEWSVWDGSSYDVSFFTNGTGDGSSENPYKISTAAQWVGFVKWSNKEITSNVPSLDDFICFELTANLKFNDGDAADWANGSEPANTSLEPAFDEVKAGKWGVEFNGNGHTISGVYMTTGAVVGLFGNVWGQKDTDFTVLENLRIENSYFYCAGGWVGSLLAETAGSTIIRNIYVGSDVYVDSGSNVAGGIVGGAYHTGPYTVKIYDSVFEGTVTSEGNNNGGIIGNGNSSYKTNDNRRHHIEIENCLVTGSVTGGENSNGFVGGNQNDTSTTIKNSIYAGKGFDEYPFGAGNHADADFTVENCYTTTWGTNDAGYKTNNGTEKTDGITEVTIEELTGLTARKISGFTRREGAIMLPSGIIGEEAATLDGLGTEASPYLIRNAEDWLVFADLSKKSDYQNFSGKYVALDADIDFEGVGVSPITNFAGTFDGKGHTIRNLSMSGGGDVALFCASHGTYQNLLITDSSFTCTGNWVAPLLCCTNADTVVNNIYVSETVTVSVTGTQGNSYASGLIGGGAGSTESIEINGCVFAGTVSATGKHNGGLLGSAYKATSVTIKNSIVMGKVPAQGDEVDGSCGFVGNCCKYADKTPVLTKITMENCIYAGGAEDDYYFNRPFFLHANEAEVTNCYTIAVNSNGKVYNDVAYTDENSGVTKFDNIKDLVGISAAITVDGFTKRDGDVMVPNGVASFAPSWYVPPTLEGEGTSTSPYLIGSAEDWLTFISLTKDKNFKGEYVVLTADIDFDGVTVSHIEGFAGTFDGKNYTIKNLHMTGVNEVGLFCTSGEGAVLKNVVIKSSSFKGSENWIGTIACCAGANMTIQNIYVDRDVSVVSQKTDTAYAGGILGGTFSSGKTIVVEDCVFAGTVTAKGMYASGIVGQVQNGNNVTVRNCLNLGEITSVENYVAGIATAEGKSGSLLIENCVNIGELSGNNYVGGIYAGCLKGTGVTVQGCYSASNVISFKLEEGTSFDVTASNNQANVKLTSLIGPNAVVPATFAKRTGDFAVPAGANELVPMLLTLEMVKGAQVRLDAPTGIRFSALLGGDYLNSLKGDKDATFGIIIARTEDVEAIDQFTVADLVDGEYIYLDIPAEILRSGGEAEGYYDFVCAWGGIDPSNYARDFSAIAYVKVDGEYTYSAYDPEDNSRSIAYVAQKAYEDTNYEKTSEYKYQIDGVDGSANVWSPYTPEERTLLLGFFGQNALDLNFLSYNIRNVEDTSGWIDRPTYEYTDREKYVRDYLVSYGADIIGLQEACKLKATIGTLDWFDTLGDEDTVAGLTAAGYACVKGKDVLSHDGDKDIYNPIYYRTDKFELVTSGTWWLTSDYENCSVIAGSDTRKAMNFVVLRDKATGQEFIYVNVHLVVRRTNYIHDEGGNDTKHYVQELEVIYLRKLLQKLQDTYDLPMFVGGDFNNSYSGINTWFENSVKGENDWDITTGTPTETVELSVARDQAVSKAPKLYSCTTDDFTEINPEAIAENWGAIDLWYTSNMDGFVHVYQIIDNKSVTGSVGKYPSDHLPARLYVTLYY